jgi:peptide/nickel transport system substrate-binding protein
MIVLVGCAPLNVETPNPNLDTLYYGLAAEPDRLDPHISDDIEVGIVLRHVYDTLVYRDPFTDVIVPGLAQSWSISPDGLTYSFVLRQGIVFHDGTVFNAQAVAVNLDRILNPETNSRKARQLLGPFVSYSVVDDHNIQFNLSQPFAPLLDGLSQVYLAIASPAALQSYSVSRYQFHQVGTGPYRLMEYIPGRYIKLQLSERYDWRPAFYQIPSENRIASNIEFRFIPTAIDRMNAISTGDVDIVSELLPSDARLLAGNADIQLFPVRLAGQPSQFIFNTQEPPTNALSVRQALILATNRDGIVDGVFQRFSAVAWGPINRSGLYSARMDGAYSADTGLAQQLLADMGYSDSNQDGYWDFGGSDLIIRLIIPRWELLPEVGETIRQQWAALGIRAVIEPESTFNGLVERVSIGNYNMVSHNELSVDPFLLERFFGSSGDLNWSGFSDPALDELLISGSKEMDPTVRNEIYIRIQEYIMNQALILPINEVVALNAADSSVRNLAFDDFGIPYLFLVEMGD